MNTRYLVAFLSLVATAPVTADVTETIARAVEDGSVSLSFRYRYELVDDASFAKDANANTLKSRLTFAPSFSEEWNALVEFDDVRHVGSARFNDTRNGKTIYPTVLDPDGTDLNQAFVRYTGLKDGDITLGRQRILRGNQRFVGGVGWRQNEQTYDALSLNYEAEDSVQVFYAYVHQVNRIFGPERGTPARNFDSNSHLLDLKYRLSNAVRVSGYGYLLDLEEGAVFSNATYGVRVDGELASDTAPAFRYGAEYARQTDYGDNPVNYSADYYRLEIGADIETVSVDIGYEVLGGNATPGGGFRTPLATLHKFQGWSDRFGAGTAAGLDDGIKDAFIGVSTNALRGKLTLVYHDFEADRGGADLGSEIDVSAAWKLGKNYGVLLKYATYDGSATTTDLDKFWLQLTASF